MKKYLAVILSCIMLLSQGTVIFAAETEGPMEQYELIERGESLGNTYVGIDDEVMPLTLYLANVYTSIVKVSSTKVSIGAQAICSEKMQSIKVIYILQKKVNDKWVDVGSTSSTLYDVSNTSKSYTVSGISSGTYRCKASAKATAYNGYSETLTGYSGSISI